MARPSVYLDYCATTPVADEVRAAMLRTLEADFGNPSSMHWAGRRAAELVAEARARVAAGVGSLSEEIHFTSGATEADNLALFGVVRQYAPGHAHLITTAVEHHAILHAAGELVREGYSVTFLPVDGHGNLDPELIERAIRPETVLVSVMLVNNEVGTIEPVAEAGRIAHEHQILMHTDAVQGVGLLDVNVDELNVDLLSLSAHKIYGPKGIGALYVRQGTGLQPLTFGGPQEHGLRPGTENVPGIVGLGAAMQLVGAHKAGERERLQRLRDYMVQHLQERIPDLVMNGPQEQGQVAAHVLSISVPGADSEMILLQLNNQGIALSLGSACNSHSIEPSHVLEAMGLPREQIEGTVRVSLGYPTQAPELDHLLEVLPSIVERARIAENIAEGKGIVP